jgi:ATP-dependent DNA helicase RecG
MRDIAKGHIVSRRYRNRRIGEFLKELDLTEGRATGIPKIQKALKANGSPAPKFSTDEERSAFVATIRIHPDFLARPEPVAVAPDVAVIDRVVAVIRGQVRGQVREQVREQVISVLEYCREARGRKDILKHIGVTPLYKNFQKRLQPLIDAGLLHLTVPGKPRSRNQQYVVVTELTQPLERK